MFTLLRFLVCILLSWYYDVVGFFLIFTFLSHILESFEDWLTHSHFLKEFSTHLVLDSFISYCIFIKKFNSCVLGEHIYISHTFHTSYTFVPHSFLQVFSHMCEQTLNVDPCMICLHVSLVELMWMPHRCHLPKASLKPINRALFSRIIHLHHLHCYHASLVLELLVVICIFSTILW